MPSAAKQRGVHVADLLRLVHLAASFRIGGADDLSAANRAAGQRHAEALRPVVAAP